MVGPPRLRPRLTRASRSRADRGRRAARSCATSSCPASSTASGRSGRSSSCPSSRAAARRSPARSTTRWSTASPRSSSGMLLFDLSPSIEPAEPPVWEPEPAAAGLRVAVDAVADSAVDQFRAAGRVAALGLAPGRTASVARTMRRAALSVAEEALSPAPPSYLNRELGPAPHARHPRGLADPAALAQAAPRGEAERRRPRDLRRRAAAVRRHRRRGPGFAAGDGARSASAAKARQGGNRITFAFIEPPVRRALAASPRLARSTPRRGAEELGQDRRLRGDPALDLGPARLPQGPRRAARREPAPLQPDGLQRSRARAHRCSPPARWSRTSIR